jgi:hypothetical protein
MKRLLTATAALAVFGVSGAAFAQYQAYQPVPPQQGYPAYQQAPAAYPGGMTAPEPYRSTTQAQYGTSSYQYPPGPGGQWQQSYQLGARPDMSGSTNVPVDAAISQGTRMENPAYMPSAARLGTDGGVTVPAYGSAAPPPVGYGYPPGYGYPVR